MRYCLSFLLFIFLSFSPLWAAADLPIKIKANNLKYFEDRDYMEASGSVEVQLKDVTIFADQLLMDSVTNFATAEGNVRLSSPRYSANARTVFYDANTDLPIFYGFKSVSNSSNVRGSIYIGADYLNDRKDYQEGKEGWLSTCGDTAPHFLLRAKKIRYRPNKRIEAWNVTYYVGDIPLMWLPYVFYDYGERRKRNWTFGHNDVEGDFVKTAWSYPGGQVLLDDTQYKGWGSGLSTNFDSVLGTGALYLYLMDEKDTGVHDRIEKMSLANNLTPHTRLNLYHNYLTTYLVPSGRMDQTSSGFSLDYSDLYKQSLSFSNLSDRLGLSNRYTLKYSESSGRANTSYNYNYEFGGTNSYMRQSQSFTTNFPLSSHAQFSSTVNYFNNTTQTGDSGEERIDPQIEIKGSEANFSWAMRENWVLDLRRYLYPNEPRYEYVEKLPEIEISPKPLDLKLFALSSTLGYGEYREIRYLYQTGHKRDYRTERYRANLSANKSFPLGWGSTLSLNANLDQYLYGPGDQLYKYSENGSITTSLGGFFRNSVSYRKGESDGNSPFLFDTLGSTYHDGRESLLFYYLNKFSWSWDTGFNWQTSRWFDLMTHLKLSPDQWLNWTTDCGWDIENRLYKDLVSGVQWVPSDSFSSQLSLDHDLNVGQLRSLSALYDFFFLKDQPNQMHFRLSQVYDPITRELKVRDIMLVKDLHCWDMTFTYSDYRKEFAVTFNLKAIPDEPVGFSSGRGFYFEGFEKGMQQIQQEIKPAESVNRY